MNGLDDYKNILSGGIRVVDWNYEPTTSVEGSPAATLEIGDAIVARGSGSGSEGYYVYFTASYTTLCFIACDGAANPKSVTRYMTDNSIVYEPNATSIVLQRLYTIRGSDYYVFDGVYRWLVLRIA